MKYEPILKRKMDIFKQNMGYNKENDSFVFERFINDIIASVYQPDATTKNSSLLEMISVGGQDDMGIDGIAIKVNGSFVSSTQEIDNIISINKTISVEFLFIQSKYKDEIDSGEFAKFADGVYDFLSNVHYEPHNEKINQMLELKDYIFSDLILPSWKDAPIVRTYYVIFGEWRENEHINGKVKSLTEKILSLDDYSDVIHKNYGTPQVNKLYEENHNSFSSIINVLGSLDFEEVNGVSNSQAILCSATEYMKLLITDEGELRRNLFTDNVRDYQGNTQINQNMLETLQNDPSAFQLLNNGITIVCSKLLSGNRKVTITNPQIVNGCQTSNVLYSSFKNGIDLTKVFLLVKVIATEETSITNNIVKGTNSQNPVFSESFETTRAFHKQLEEFIDSIQSDISDPDAKIYYERRAKQYESNLTVKRFRTFSMDTLAHSVISCFLESPFDSVLHIVRLLEKYRNSIFVDTQSFYPYYISALLCLNFEKLILDKKIDQKNDVYKFYILAIIVEMINCKPVDINARNIDSVCEKIKEVISNEDSFFDVTQKAINFLERTINLWVERQGTKYKHGIKDNPTFSKFLFVNLRGGNINNIDIPNEDTLVRRGKVISAKQDRAGKYYGFISGIPDNVFFHSEDNPRIDFSNIVGKTVTYRIKINPVNGKDKAHKVYVVN